MTLSIALCKWALLNHKYRFIDIRTRSFPVHGTSATRRSDPFEVDESDFSSGDESDDDDDGSTGSSAVTSEAESVLYLSSGESRRLVV